jgi:hypothetical protein
VGIETGVQCNGKSKDLWTRIIGLLRSRRKERVSLKEANISKDNVPPKIWGIPSITFLKTRIAEEKTLEGFCSKFIFTWSKVVNKVCAPKDEEEHYYEGAWYEPFQLSVSDTILLRSRST